jgi:pimeloyl-ACP methyl ester carboxylesterase
LCIAISWLAACAGPAARAAREAAQAGFTALRLQGTPFVHVAYFRELPPESALWVFFDGDGRPWIRGGSDRSTDPTPRHPLGLDLAIATPGSVLYVGRPCHFTAREDRACESDQWTTARYGERVVASLSGVVERFAADHGYRRIILVGYSGGGSLAALVAARVPRTIAVITVSANLDIDRWTALHGYSPLTGSLNPANQAPLRSDIRQIHLAGDLDQNVPPTLIQGYVDHLPPGSVWRYSGFDHVCCWVAEWPRILTRLRTAVN